MRDPRGIPDCSNMDDDVGLDIAVPWRFGKMQSRAHLRMVANEGRHDGRDMDPAEAKWRDNPQGAGKHATAETIRQPVDARQQRLSFKDKLFAFRREAQPSGAANDKIAPENSLQLLQSHGKRRRRDIEDG